MILILEAGTWGEVVIKGTEKNNLKEVDIKPMLPVSILKYVPTCTVTSELANRISKVTVVISDLAVGCRP